MLRNSVVSLSADVFSFAVVMWELLTWQQPYEDMMSVQVTIYNKQFRLWVRVLSFVVSYQQVLPSCCWREVHVKVPVGKQRQRVTWALQAAPCVAGDTTTHQCLL